MRAVNLIPEELRPRIPGEGDPRIAYGVLGGLSLLLVMILLAISYSNKLNTIQDQTAALKAETQRHQTVATTVAVNPDTIGEQVKNRTLLVGGLAEARFPWGDALYDLSRAIPDDTTLNTITAASAAGTADGGGGEASGASTMSLDGCTSGWQGYSRFMTWLRQMPGVDTVESTSSAVASAAEGEADAKRVKNCGPAPLMFSLTVKYSPRTLDLLGLPKPQGGGATGATGAAPAGVPASSATPTPAPAPPAADAGAQ